MKPPKIEILAKVVRQLGNQIDSGDTFDILADGLETGAEEEVLKAITALRCYANGPLRHERPALARNMEELADQLAALTPEELAQAPRAGQANPAPYWGLTRRHIVILTAFLLLILAVSGLLIFILIEYGK